MPMRKLIVNEFMSLDGVVQAGGAEDEDRDGGFRHGGWHMGYSDDLGRQWVVDYITAAGGFLLGRRTYEIFAGYWPNAPAEVQGIAESLNTKPKHVATRTLSDPLEWENSTVLQGDLAEAVTALKQQDDGDLYVIGSAQLVHSLLEHDLVDELRLAIDPLVLGGGKSIFPSDGTLRRLRLVDCAPTSTGVILATYARAED
jgi:dihydrofolate reductase